MRKDMTYQINGVVLDEGIGLTLGELCHLCKANAEQIMAMVDEGLVAPRGSQVQNWHFDGTCVKRVQIALRLQQDLQVNLAGAALVLELLEELQELRRWRRCQNSF
jgi:chaperone modulatory protein CbpM